jgi:HAD superfamily hydrolase (TIGR01509 family)
MTDRLGTPIAAVVFDMDGVLIDSEPIHFAAIYALLADHGVTAPSEQEEAFFGHTALEVFRILRAHYDLVPDETALASDWIARVVELLSQPLVPMPGLPGVLGELRDRGLRLALASGSAPPIVAATLHGLGLGQAFEVVVSADEVAKGKPAPDIFLETARRLGVRPEACLVIEDSLNGVNAAVAAGMACVAVPCHSTRGQDFSSAAVRLDSLAELPGWLDARRAGERTETR